MKVFGSLANVNFFTWCNVMRFWRSRDSSLIVFPFPLSDSLTATITRTSSKPSSPSASGSTLFKIHSEKYSVSPPKWSVSENVFESSLPPIFVL